MNKLKNLIKWAEKRGIEGPVDLSENHDKYLWEYPEYLTTKEVTEILGVSRQLIWWYCKTGVLKSVQFKPRGRHHFLQSEILAFRDGK